MCVSTIPSTVSGLGQNPGLPSRSPADYNIRKENQEKLTVDKKVSSHDSKYQ